MKKKLINEIMDAKVEPHNFGNITIRREDKHSTSIILVGSRSRIRAIGGHNYYEKDSDGPLSHISVSCRTNGLISRTINLEGINRKRDLEIKRELAEKERATILENLSKFCIDEINDDLLGSRDSLGKRMNEINNIKKKRI